jgi:hypothetical protein
MLAQPRSAGRYLREAILREPFDGILRVQRDGARVRSELKQAITGDNPNCAIAIFEDRPDSWSGSDGYEVFSSHPAHNVRVGAYQ